jgi:hypothetical protein
MASNERPSNVPAEALALLEFLAVRSPILAEGRYTELLLTLFQMFTVITPTWAEHIPADGACEDAAVPILVELLLADDTIPVRIREFITTCCQLIRGFPSCGRVSDWSEERRMRVYQPLWSVFCRSMTAFHASRCTAPKPAGRMAACLS